MEERFYIDGEVIPSIEEKPVKSLGRWYTLMLSDRGKLEELRKFVVKAINTIDKTFLHGKFKLWRLQFGLWPFTVYEVTISEVEKS